MRITIDPVTRISGFLEIRAEAEDNKIISAEAEGLLYRGFETMLKGRAPLDAIFFNERICGICSAAHSYASTLALDNALGVSVSTNDRMLRDIVHGFEYIQNHLRHFYLFAVPDFVKLSSVPIAVNQQNSDYRIPEEESKTIENNYITSIKLGQLAHEGQAVLGGKAPHNHGIFVGGVNAIIDAYKLEQIRTITRSINDFVSTAMVNDVYTIAKYYPDYMQKGMSYPNFMSYGVFDYDDPDISYVKPGVMVNGVRYPLQPEYITEQVVHSWFKEGSQTNEIDLTKPDAYTFIKAPRYNGLPMEVGPLARQLISGEYNGGNSCIDRNIARVLETVKILKIMQNLVNRIELLPNTQKVYNIPQTAFGIGMIDTTRGSLGDWVLIENQVISKYNIITPSMWNLSPKDAYGNPGVVERALIDTTLNNVNEPVEIGRIVRSFDPCVSCATHLIGGGRDKIIEVPV